MKTEKVICERLDLVKKIAWDYSKRTGVEVEDLISVGNLGLVKAVQLKRLGCPKCEREVVSISEKKSKCKHCGKVSLKSSLKKFPKFKEWKHTQLNTFLYNAIKGEILNYLNEERHSSVRAKSLNCPLCDGQIRRKGNKFVCVHCSEVYEDKVSLLRKHNVVSIDMPIAEDLTYHDILQGGDAKDIYETVDNNIVRSELMEIAKKINKQAEIIIKGQLDLLSDVAIAGQLFDEGLMNWNPRSRSEKVSGQARATVYKMKNDLFAKIRELPIAKKLLAEVC